MELVIERYKNISGEEFSYEVSRSNVPDNADYFMYNILVEVIQTKEKRNFLLFIRKSQIHESWNEADGFVLGRPLTFFKKEILDEYQNGSVPLKWPGGDDWFMWGFLPDN